jgi:hypothetical protein
VRKFDWGQAEDVKSVATMPAFDYVVGADCVFSLSATALLCDCLDAVMKENSTIGFMSIETRDPAVTKAFVDGMNERKFDVSVVSLAKVPKEYQHQSMSIYRFQRKI